MAVVQVRSGLRSRCSVCSRSFSGSHSSSASRKAIQLPVAAAIPVFRATLRRVLLPDKAYPVAVRAGNLGGVIRRAVIDNNDLFGRPRLCQHTVDARPIYRPALYAGITTLIRMLMVGRRRGLLQQICNVVVRQPQEHRTQKHQAGIVDRLLHTRADRLPLSFR